MHRTAITGYKKITIRDHRSENSGRGFEDDRYIRVQSITEKAYGVLFFRPDERNNIEAPGVQRRNEFVEISDWPTFAPCLPSADENPNGRSSRTVARQSLYFPFPFFFFRAGKSQ
jgi:hypothetical protein